MAAVELEQRIQFKSYLELFVRVLAVHVRLGLGVRLNHSDALFADRAAGHHWSVLKGTITGLEKENLETIFSP